MKKLLGLLLAVVMVLSVAACTKEDPKPTVKSENYSTIATFDLTTFDYLYNNKSSNGDYLMNWVEGLIGQEQHGKLIGACAETWSSNEDATVWTFNIRKGVNWSTADKEVYGEVTANDFVAGLRHAADSKSQTLSLVQTLIVGLDDYVAGTASWDEVGCKAVDEYTLVYELTEPTSYFDSMTTYAILYPVNEEFLESKGEGCKLGAYDATTCGFGALQADSILYNSAYILTNYTAQSVVEFDANPNYWDKENVFVQHATITYTDGSDPAQAYNMFKSGEIVSCGINEKLADVVADAEANFGNNIYMTDTTSSTYWGAFNFNRRSYSLCTDSSKGISVKTDAQKADTYKAIQNKYFRLAVYAAFDSVQYEAITLGDLGAGRVRNTLTPWTFVTLSDGTAYGALVQKFAQEMDPEFFGDVDLTDGHDAWYNPERAVALMAKAVAELGDSVTYPIHLDIPNLATSDTQNKRALLIKAMVEAVLGDYVVVDILNFDNSDDYYYAFYDVETGSDNCVDLSFGAGWGPDYADPKTYVFTYEPVNGDMMHYSGLNIANDGAADETDDKAKEVVGFYEFGEMLDTACAIQSDNDARWTEFAKAEAYLLVNGLIRPFGTSGANRAISRVQAYSGAYGLYGAASYNSIPMLKYMIIGTEPITTEAHDTAKAAWLKGE